MSAKVRVLIADDEPFYHEWLVDFLEKKDVDVDFAVNIEEAVEKLTSHNYRFIIVDLSIPLNDTFTGTLTATESVFLEYPGLYIADVARNNGYRTRQVIVYSVHISESIQEYVDRLYCTYIPKGRPASLKEEIEEVLSYSPGQEPPRG